MVTSERTKTILNHTFGGKQAVIKWHIQKLYQGKQEVIKTHIQKL